MNDAVPDAGAYDPSTGDYYILGGQGLLQSVNVTTGAASDVGTLGIPDIATNGLQFDADGTLWVESDGSGSQEADLWTVLPSALGSSQIEVGPLTLGGVQFYSAGLLITPSQPAAEVSSAKVAPGATVTVTGTGFTAGESVGVYLDSSSTALTTLTATGTGAVSTTVTIPKTDADGAHKISLVGAISGTATAALTVAPVLATTGVDAQSPLEFGGILLLLGAVVVVARRLTRMRANR